MNHAMRRNREFADNHLRVRRFTIVQALKIVLTAMSATAVWAGILILGGWLLGISIAPIWLALILAVIFGLLIIGLSMLMAASHNTPSSPFPNQPQK